MRVVQPRPRTHPLEEAHILRVQAATVSLSNEGGTWQHGTLTPIDTSSHKTSLPLRTPNTCGPVNKQHLRGTRTTTKLEEPVALLQPRAFVSRSRFPATCATADLRIPNRERSCAVLFLRSITLMWRVRSAGGAMCRRKLCRVGKVSKMVARCCWSQERDAGGLDDDETKIRDSSTLTFGLPAACRHIGLRHCVLQNKEEKQTTCRAMTARDRWDSPASPASVSQHLHP